MDEPIKKYREIDDMLDMSDLFDDEKSSINPDDSIRDSVLGGQVIKDGIQTQDLQTVINGWAEALNESAIATAGENRSFITMEDIKRFF